jgi:hypothetical protein
VENILLIKTENSTNRSRDLAFNTFVPFNFIPTYFRTRRAKLREQLLFMRWRGWKT